MTKYIVKFEAKNVRFQFEGSESDRSNFLTHFHVEAASPEAAVDATEKLLADDEKINDLLDRSPDFDPPECQLELLSEVESFEDRAMPRTGLIFYDENLN